MQLIYSNAEIEVYCRDGEEPNWYKIAHKLDTHTLASLNFQNGPIKEVGVNGVTTEAILAILIDRTRRLNEKAASMYNSAAIGHMILANNALHQRTIDREERGVEGTSQK